MLVQELLLRKGFLYGDHRLHNSKASANSTILHYCAVKSFNSGPCHMREMFSSSSNTFCTSVVLILGHVVYILGRTSEELLAVRVPSYLNHYGQLNHGTGLFSLLLEGVSVWEYVFCCINCPCRIALVCLLPPPSPVSFSLICHFFPPPANPHPATVSLQ